MIVEKSKSKKESFLVEFQELVASKSFQPELLQSKVYMEELYQLPYIIETLRACRKKTWYRDHQQTITRFPEIHEIIRVHTEIKQKTEKEKYIEEPKRNTASYQLVKFGFCTNACLKLSLCPDFLWRKLDEKKIKLNNNYPRSAINFRAYLISLIGEDEFKKLKKIKQKGNVVNGQKQIIKT